MIPIVVELLCEDAGGIPASKIDAASGDKLQQKYCRTLNEV